MDFWVEMLGLRLVKRSINQDDPSTYHFFFADAAGNPGTSMTFFPWEDHSQGKVGSGPVSRTAFRVPKGSLDYWEDRFDEYGVDYDDRVERFGETVLPFRDPDGLPVELVAVEIPDDDPTEPWVIVGTQLIGMRRIGARLRCQIGTRETDDDVTVPGAVVGQSGFYALPQTYAHWPLQNPYSSISRSWH